MTDRAANVGTFCEQSWQNVTPNAVSRVTHAAAPASSLPAPDVTGGCSSDPSYISHSVPDLASIVHELSL